VANVGYMTAPEFRERRWTRVEYDRLIDTGVFKPGEPIELLGGLLVVAELAAAVARHPHDVHPWDRSESTR
jgi:hypothetical protein